MKIVKVLLKWLPLAAIILILSGTTYAAIQQNYRQGANDPQVQIAHDAATALGSGLDPASIIPSSLSVDLEKSLSLSIAVYDELGKMVGSSARIEGKQVDPPSGVFETARNKGENRFTWQPKSGVRQAAVLVHYSGNGNTKGFVLVSRSLTEIEDRIKSLSLIIALGTTAALFASLILLLLKEFVKRNFRHIYAQNDKISTDATDRSSAEMSAEGYNKKRGQ